MISRRHVLTLGAGLAGAALLPGRLVLAAAPTDQRLVVLILRGGLDGLAAVPPYAEPRYAKLRPSIAVPAPGTAEGGVDLDGTFALNPALARLAPWYRAGELLPVHAVSTGYHNRSHFDSQDVLENGGNKPLAARDGWLNRALAAFNGAPPAVAVGQTVPLILRGNVGVRTFAPNRLPAAGEDFMGRVAMLYRGDKMLSQAFASAVASTQGLEGEMERGMAPARPRDAFAELAGATGKLLKEGDARIAVMDSTGWDTHQAEVNRLGRNLSGLADGLVALRAGLGDTWSRTVVLAVTEFGRTAAENGNAGTDHGTGGVAFVAGGAVAGGRVAGDWLGLAHSSLYEGRDVAATTDHRALFKAALRDHLGLAEAAIEDTVFPNSRKVAPFAGMIRGT